MLEARSRSLSLIRAALVTVTLLATAAAPAGGATVEQVDPMIGVDAGGNVTPGAQLPFGFANPGPDTQRGDSSGYASDQPLLGFSQTHVSGTGGAGKYGNFRVTPESGPLALPAPAVSPSDELATPGYYAVTASGHTRVELTAARLGAYHRYSFARGAPAWLVLDATSVVSFTPQRQRVRSASARVTGPRSFEGSATVTGGWGLGGYRLYFAATLDHTPSVLHAWRRAHRSGIYAGYAARVKPRVGLRIGLSFRSRAAARARLLSLKGGFEAVHSRARAAWARALAPIEVTGGTNDERRTFATALYHTQVMPHDLSGDNAWWHSPDPHFEDFYTLWDTYRTVNPLLTLIDPGRESRIVRSLLDTYRHTGWLPDGRVAGNNGLTQVGSNADIVIADAAVKGLGGIDWQTAYHAVRKDAEVNSRNWAAEGRQLDPYRRLGYVPLDQRASASRTMEYSYDDFAVSEVANRVGNRSDGAHYLARSRDWRNLWDPSTRYVRPRDRQGSFMTSFDPNRFWSAWLDPYYEGTAVQWSTFVPHDASGLIRRLGGDGAASEWLRRLEHARYGPANEVDFLAPYLYTHAGRPDLAGAWVHDQAERAYSATRTGLPGNDDAGTLSAWYVWTAIGLYPNAGQAFYYVGSPLFDSARIHLGGGRVFTVIRRGPAGAKMVTHATLNARPLERAWLTHSEIASGGTLVLDMATSTSGWGVNVRPPSPAS